MICEPTVYEQHLFQRPHACRGGAQPAGRLPFTVARDARHYPWFDRNATEITYGPYHGYTLFDREGAVPRYPFGHGLSYARFAYRALKLQRAGDAVEATVSIRNEGAVAADEVAQLYVHLPGQVIERPLRLLKGFRRLNLRPGETRTLRMRVPLAALRWWSPQTRGWVFESGRYVIGIGGSSDPAGQISAEIFL